MVQISWSYFQRMMRYRADKLGVDANARTHTQTDTGNDNTRRPKLASGLKRRVVITHSCPMWNGFKTTLSSGYGQVVKSHILMALLFMLTQIAMLVWCKTDRWIWVMNGVATSDWPVEIWFGVYLNMQQSLIGHNTLRMWTMGISTIYELPNYSFHGPIESETACR